MLYETGIAGQGVSVSVEPDQLESGKNRETRFWQCFLGHSLTLSRGAGGRVFAGE